MPHRFAALAVLVFAPLAGAADPPPHAVKLFDGESAFGWTAKGDVAVKDGNLVVGKDATATTAYPLPDGTVVITDAAGNASKPDVLPGKPLTLPAGEYKGVTFTPTGLKPLFNGKDLSGWKVFKDEKREKSKFEVTKAGEIHLTNGPGDLQTEGKYADFVLQLEFKTNGDGLNSGVFFRCIPDQYQNGYECQINNAAKNGDKNTPADGGTGAIYRRQAARKIVANDREWTHLTLIARGPTFATWVNGYPVCVWTDERAKDENPRKGLRLAAGHLSIQGHDPTTDLLFRNIRLAEFGK